MQQIQHTVDVVNAMGTVDTAVDTVDTTGDTVDTVDTTDTPLPHLLSACSAEELTTRPDSKNRTHGEISVDDGRAIQGVETHRV